MTKKKALLSKEFIYTAIINVIAAIIYLVLIGSKFQTNDDTAFAMLAEGAYGDCHGQLIFMNIIWGKLLVFLYSLVPTVKWYVILQLIGLFAAFFSVTYIIYKRFGTAIGTAVNTFVLVFFGYHSYVSFQFTKTAAFAAAAGIVLIFYALECTENNSLRRFQSLIGCGLVIFSSLVRFESMAMTAVIMAGIGFIKLIEFFKDGFKKNFKEIVKYVVIFALTFSIPLGTYMVNSYYYSMNDKIVDIMEFNTYRSALWDKGFPKYDENEELYESMDLSEEDVSYFAYTWNMDTNKLTTEMMKELVDAKEKVTVDGDFFKDFFEVESNLLRQSFLFPVFLAVAVLAVISNRKNIWLALYQFGAVILLNLYLFYAGRIGLDRVDMGMWFACIITQLCIAKKLDTHGHTKKYLACVMAFLTMFSIFDFAPYINDAKVHNEKARDLRGFYQMLSDDKEHFYACTVNLDSLNECIGGSYTFWDVAEKNSGENIYYLGGWDCYIPVSMNKLKNYGIKNIYKNCINNQDIYVSSPDKKVCDQLEAYIRRNYNANAKLRLVRKIEGQYIWAVRTRSPRLDQYEFKNVDDSIKNTLKVTIDENKVSVSGHLYRENENSFEQRCYLKIKSPTADTEKIIDIACMRMERNNDLMNGMYAEIYDKAQRIYGIDNLESCEYTAILESGGAYYEVPCRVKIAEKKDVSDKG